MAGMTIFSVVEGFTQVFMTRSSRPSREKVEAEVKAEVKAEKGESCLCSA
jgi:hypothetical protein